MLKRRLGASIFIIMLILLSWLLPSAVLAQDEPAGGSISGQVINNTEGGGSVAGLAVGLYIYADDQLTEETRSAETDSEGRFRFDDIDTANKYMIEVVYMKVGYYLPVTFEEGEAEKTVEIGVCDTTTSDEDIIVMVSHAVVTVEEESILVVEVFQFLNNSYYTYVGDEGVLVFTLPEGVYDFDAPSELRADYTILDSNHVTYDVPFPPGTRQLYHAYRLPRTDSEDLTFAINVGYPTGAFELFVSGQGIEVTASQLSPADPFVSDEGTSYIHFEGADLQRGSQVSVSLSWPSGSRTVYYIVVVVIVLVALAIFLARRRKPVNQGDGDE
jgi:hypothetical protein